MKQTNKLTELTALCVAALLVSTALQTHAQGTWDTLYGGLGHVYTALLDPFSSPTQPSLFTGGMSSRMGDCLVQEIGPLNDPNVAPTSACVDTVSSAACTSLGFDPKKEWLYSVGYDTSDWLVRVSADKGKTWMTDLQAPPPVSGGQATRFATDGNWNVFICGTTADGHWIVRQRDVFGSWTTIRDLSAPGKSYIPWGMHFTPGYLFVVGEVSQKWVVERFDTVKRTWTTFNPKAPSGSGPSYGAWAVTSHGSDVYVLTWTGGNRETPKQTVLLKGTNLGAGTWTIFQTFAEGSYNRPEDLGFDLDGNLYVVGDSTSSTSAGTLSTAWIVRRWDANSGVWKWWTVEANAYARKVSVQTTGDVYITGTAYDSVNGNWWAIVQKWTP